MDRLKVPQPLSCTRVQSEQAVPEQVRALPVRSIQVEGWRPGRRVKDRALFVERHLTPYVRPAGIPVRVLRPRLIAELARPGNRVKRPHHASGLDVIRPDIAR